MKTSAMAACGLFIAGMAGGAVGSGMLADARSGTDVVRQWQALTSPAAGDTLHDGWNVVSACAQKPVASSLLDWLRLTATDMPACPK